MRADYYQLLDVEPTASAKEIKVSYYRLALRYHPDHNPGDPAAEERFKLVAEAYRTLGVPERRSEYDNWLHLHDLYQGAPELAKMSAARRTPVTPFHFSSQRARERQERRSGRDGERRRSPRHRGFLPRRSTKVNTYLFIGFYVLLFINIVPIFIRQMFKDDTTKQPPAAAAVEEKEASPAQARTRLLAMEAELRERAEAGEAEAQYKLGLYLFNKSSRGRGAEEKPALLRRAASAGFRAEAVDWLGRAAAQGHAPAQRVLKNVRQAAPAPSAP